MIDQIARETILDLLSFDIPTAGQILNCSDRKVYNLVREGKLIARADKPGGRGVTITAASLKAYCQLIEVPQDVWDNLAGG